MDFTKKTLLLIAFFVVPFCDTIASQSASYLESKAVPERMGNNHGDSDNFSGCDSSSDILTNAIGRDWNLMEELLNLTDQTSSEAYINMNYEIIWLQLQRNTSMLHSKAIFKFATYAENNVYLKKELKKNVTQCTLDETSQFLSELLYPRNVMNTELTNAILKYLNLLNHTTLATIFNRIFDNLSCERSLVSIANRLYILPLSSKQLATAYTYLTRRAKSLTDQEAIEAIYQNIEELCVRNNMSLRNKLLRKADTIRMRSKYLKNDNNLPSYVGLCRNLSNVCVPARKSVNIHVERSRLSADKGSILYAFKIPGVGYISWEGDSASITNETFWWEVRTENELFITNSNHSLCTVNSGSDQNPISIHRSESLECSWDIELGN